MEKTIEYYLDLAEAYKFERDRLLKNYNTKNHFKHVINNTLTPFIFSLGMIRRGAKIEEVKEKLDNAEIIICKYLVLIYTHNEFRRKELETLEGAFAFVSDKSYEYISHAEILCNE